MVRRGRRFESARGLCKSAAKRHLGGGADDSLLQFKVRFDEGGLVESAVGKEIHDEQAYRALGGQGYDGWFPAYRSTACRSRPPACWLAARGGLRS